MAREVTERRHFAPRQMGVPLLDFIRQLLAGFADHGEAIGQSVIGLVVRHQFVKCPTLHRLFGPSDQKCEIIKDIQYAGHQKTRTISSSMRVRKRGRRPIRDTRSTLVPSPSDNSSMAPA